MTVRQPVTAVGFTQASIVTPAVGFRLVAFGTDTHVLEPLNWIAPPYLPVADHVPFASVPLLLFPDASATAVPLPASKPYAATSPAGCAVTTALACADAALMLPAASSAVTR